MAPHLAPPDLVSLASVRIVEPSVDADLAGQGISGFRYAYSTYEAEYSRNLLFRSGAQTEDLFDRICDRTQPGWVIPTLRTLSGLKNRSHSTRPAGRRRKP